MMFCKPYRSKAVVETAVSSGLARASRFNRRHASILGAALLAAAALGGDLATAAQPVPSAANSSVIEEHALAQQGFSIALASVVLQTHLYYALVQSREIDYTRNTCQALDPHEPASGGWEVTIPDPNQTNNQRLSFFYDAACTRLYTTLDPSLTDANGVIGTFYTVDGKPNGTLTTTGGFDDRSLKASGLGTFIGPIGSTAKASLGITCVDASDTVLDCSGGVVQDFASLNQSLGSVTPLALNIGNDSGLTFKTLQPAAFSSGNTGALTLGYTDATQTDLHISGGSAYGSDTASGEAGSFSLFPAPPTDWTDVDTTHDTQFQIHVVDNTTRNLNATISTLSTGKVLATATLDQSGTGTITFSDQSQASVISWVIADSPTTNDGPVILNQEGLTGTWYNPLRGGQGIVMQVFPDLIASGQGILFGGWFTFDTAPAGGTDKQRWYTLQGLVTNSSTASVGLYTATGGNFDAPPSVATTAVGTATISFSDCSHGTLGYTFSDGSGRSGYIPLTRLDTSINCSAKGDNGVNLGKAALSGTWFDPHQGGQGFVFDISPNQNVLFAGWYTFAQNGQQVGGGASQRWYTLQGLLTPNGSATGLYLTNVGIFTAAGGVFNDPTRSVNSQVGVATVAFDNCNKLTVSYSFTVGASAGQSGTLNLVRTGPTPPACNF